MKKQILILTLALMMCLALTIIPAVAATNSWEGSWEMTGQWGTMTIEEDEEFFMGECTLYESYFVGTISDNIYSGYWFNFDDDCSGEFEATMSADGMSFDMKWNNDGDEGWNSPSEKGTRTTPLQTSEQTDPTTEEQSTPTTAPTTTPLPTTSPETDTAPDSGVKVFLDGNRLTFDVPPQIMNDRTMVPLRAIFEAMGASVDWEGSTQTVTATKDDTVVVLVIGNTSPTINGQVVEIDQPGVVIDGRTLAPLRFIGEAFGGKVDWDGPTQTVTITSGAGTTQSTQQTQPTQPEDTPVSTPTPPQALSGDSAKLAGKWAREFDLE